MLKKQKDSNLENLPPKLPETPQSFFAQQVKHQYGTCWRCEHARETPGGSPGGKDTYWCKQCQQWLTIRLSPKDTRSVDVVVVKETVKAKSKVAIDRSDPAVDELDL